MFSVEFKRPPFSESWSGGKDAGRAQSRARHLTASQLREAYAPEVVTTSFIAQSVRAMTGGAMTKLCRVLDIARRTAYCVARPLAVIVGRPTRRAVTNSRATYGYRRVWAMATPVSGAEDPEARRGVYRRSG